jgi:hydrogenase maturation protein HypF
VPTQEENAESWGAPVRRKIQITGVVQGVGFRPFIYRLATECRLSGYVLNDSSGVVIEVQGPMPLVDAFARRIRPEAPSMSRIVSLSSADLPLDPRPNGFRILESHAGAEQCVLISPDIATCEDCLRELLDPNDRRYGYPFINCTNCGPRFTIVRDIPYDRPFTTMSVFPMCSECEGEYHDPANRRFHAQPNACWKCGPQLEFRSEAGVASESPISDVVLGLRNGQIGAIKGLGGFHLAVDATNSAAVERLRARKHRVEKPFAVMVANIETAERVCVIDDAVRRLLLSPQRPIVLVPKRADSEIAEAVAPGNRDLGIFLPYTPMHHLLFAEGKFAALVMTSANLSEEPICIDNDEAIRRLAGIADCFLLHNREILIRSDDSVLRVVDGRLRQLRRSRGFVPMPVFVESELPSILAVGGELKNTICYTRGKTAFLSQHVGDLENMESYGFFGETVHHLGQILEIEPKTIAYDLHPGYFSTQWARKQTGVRLIGVQHHHAHIASCMAENKLDGKVIGFALDGTGYGTDGHIWGGEVLVVDYGGFERAGHFEYVAMAGGEAAIREPWRMAICYLWYHSGRDFISYDLPFLRKHNRRSVELICQALDKKINSPWTSSAGRLFDAVSALSGVRSIASYEGQAAIELEMAIDPEEDDACYPFELKDQEGRILIGTRPLFDALLVDLASRVSAGVISRRFHNGMANALAEVARRVRKRTGLNRVCLSGGTFQNLYLFTKLQSLLTNDCFQVFAHSEVPAGDGGLSLGQAMVAASLLNPK